jgi:hypothetical protein
MNENKFHDGGYVPPISGCDYSLMYIDDCSYISKKDLEKLDYKSIEYINNFDKEKFIAAKGSGMCLPPNILDIKNKKS